MTDQELSSRVARECFGWRVVYRPGGCADLPVMCEADDGVPFRWEPLTDARDAERVWDLLRERFGVVSVHKMDSAEGHGEWCWVEVASGLEFPGDPSWKRALSLAAVQAAALGVADGV